MSLETFKPKHIGLATTVATGTGIMIPRTGTGGGGEYGTDITNDLRTFAITREPVAHRMVFTVAHDIFDNWFELRPEGMKEGEETNAFDKKVQTELAKLKAKQELTRMAVFERAYGYAILVLGYADQATILAEPLEGEKELINIKAYGPTQISKVDEVTDKTDARYGLPKFYYITQGGMVGNLKVHYTRVIHFSTRLLAHDWQGLSVLDAIWDDLNVLRNIRWGMGQTMYRYGSGFPDLTFTGAEKTDIEDFISSGAFENLSARTYFAHSDAQTLEFKGLEGRALDPMNYYLPPMEHISCGSGIPLAILRGVQAGALTGSEVNQAEYYGLISDEQSGYEEGIRDLVTRILRLTTDTVPEFTFNWKGGFELDEEKKANIEKVKADTLLVKAQWHTRNEIRKMEDPTAKDLKPDQGGDEIIGRATPFTAMGEGKPAFDEKKALPSDKEEGDSFIVTELKKKKPQA